MNKKFLNLLPLISSLLIAQIAQPAQAKEAHCVVKGAANEVRYSGKCNFEQFGGNGSFTIQAPSGNIAGNISISVSIMEPGVADVRGLTSNGVNSRWGGAVRSNSDKACWVGSDFTICAY